MNAATKKRTKKTCKKGKPSTQPASRVETGQGLQAQDSSSMMEVPGAPREGSSDGLDSKKWSSNVGEEIAIKLLENSTV